VALCVQLQVDGTLVPTGEAIDACTGYVLLSPAEHAWSSLLHQAFDAPDLASATELFVGGFGLVLLIYVGARIAGAVASFFD
jgi:hypothetical protein